MNNPIKTFMACALAGVLLCLTARASGMAEFSVNSFMCQGHDILIQPCPPIPAEAPRTPIYNPFYATLETTDVLLGCYCNYGTVSVSVVSTAGDYYSTGFDTEEGIIILPISGLSGHYTLTIVCAGGIVFGGEFDI